MPGTMTPTVQPLSSSLAALVRSVVQFRGNEPQGRHETSVAPTVEAPHDTSVQGLEQAYQEAVFASMNPEPAVETATPPAAVAEPAPVFTAPPAASSMPFFAQPEQAQGAPTPGEPAPIVLAVPLENFMSPNGAAPAPPKLDMNAFDPHLPEITLIQDEEPAAPTSYARATAPAPTSAASPLEGFNPSQYFGIGSGSLPAPAPTADEPETSAPSTDGTSIADLSLTPDLGPRDAKAVMQMLRELSTLRQNLG